MLKRITLAALTLLTAAASPAAAGDGRGARDAPAIELFSEPNYQGAAQIFFAEDGDLSRQGFNDVARSARIRGAQDWTLCQHAFFQGRCVTLSGDTPDLARVGLAGSVSSLRPEQVAGWPQRQELRLFESEGFAGRVQAVRDAQANLNAFGFNDVARSLVAYGRWEVCEHANFAGRCRIVAGEVADLRQIGLLGAISSARPAEFAAPPHAPPGWDQSRPDAIGRTAAFFARPVSRAADLAGCPRDRWGAQQCAAARADDFCLAQGFRDAAYFSTERGRFGETLEDVLCVR